MTTATFNCYSTPSSDVDALLRPWPKCGISSLPTSITGTVTYSGTTPGICPYANGTYTVTWSQLNPCSSTYITLNHPVAISINLPGFMPGEHDTGGNIFGFITSYVISSQNNGACVWTAPSGPWVFSGGFTASYTLGGQTCTMVVTITGVA